MVDERIGQHHRTEFQAALQRTFFGEILQNVAAEPADGTFFDGNQRFVPARKPQDFVSAMSWLLQADALEIEIDRGGSEQTLRLEK